MAQSLETPPAPVLGEPSTTSDWERDEKARNVPGQTPVARVADSVSRWASDEDLDWKSFVAKYFPGTRRHNFRAIVAYSDYKRFFHPNRGSASEQNTDAPSIEEWENEGGAPSVSDTRP